MTKIYVVEMMASDNYNAMMCGSYNYRVERAYIEAIDAEQAVAKAQQMYPTMIINKGYVKTTDEIQQIEDERKARIAAEQAKEDARKARAAQREAERAEAMNMTVAEYKEYKKMKANMKRHETEMRKAQEAMAEAQRRMNYEAKRVAEYEAKIRKIEERVDK